jgi:hypothetical protein
MRVLAAAIRRRIYLQPAAMLGDEEGHFCGAAGFARPTDASKAAVSVSHDSGCELAGHFCGGSLVKCPAKAPTFSLLNRRNVVAAWDGNPLKRRSLTMAKKRQPERRVASS